MGSGPTSWLSSFKKPHALLLMSPYTSIKDAARSLFGWASFISFFVYEKFRLFLKVSCIGDQNDCHRRKKSIKI